MERIRIGLLALQSGLVLPVQVMESGNGFYIGTEDPLQGPISRESEEYFPARSAAETALEQDEWTQRQHP